MGCDIHIVIEYKPKGRDEWVSVYSSESTPWMRTRAETPTDLGAVVTQRHYAFFGQLAGVRTDDPNVPKPKGLPDGLSALAQMDVDTWADDGHSYSWDTLEHFCIKWTLANGSDEQILAAHKAILGEGSTDEIVTFLVGDYISVNEYSCYRVVYWFDN